MAQSYDTAAGGQEHPDVLGLQGRTVAMQFVLASENPQERQQACVTKLGHSKKP
jgi:hypothetical protein